MNKLFLLLKNQLRGAFKKTPQTPGQRRGRMGMGAAMLIGGAAIVYLVVMFCMSLAEPLKAVGQLELLPAIMMAAASLMTLITSIYKTNGLLFGFKDYDALMSLPIKTGTIVTSRLIMLYSMNIFYCMAIMIPSAVVYAVYAQPSAAFVPIFIICLLLTPLVPIIIATVIGSLITWAASHFKRKSGAGVVLTIAFLLLWMLFISNMQSIVENFVSIGQQIADSIYRIYPLAKWFALAIGDISMAAFLSFVAVSLAAYAVFVAIVGKNFTRINSAITATRTSSNYRLTELKESSPLKALCRKELKRFTSSSAYLLNAGIGYIMLVIAAVVVVVMGIGDALALAGFGEISGELLSIIPIGMGFFIVMSCPAASAVSLEGKNLWILKSLPVKTREIIKSKLFVNVMLSVFTVLFCSTLFCIAMQPSLPVGIMMFLTPLSYGLFSAFLGLSLNLSHPNFDWDNEVRVIKQSLPVTAVILLGMAITIVPAILCIFAGWVLYVTTAAMVLIDLLLYRRLMSRGVKLFEAF